MVAIKAQQVTSFLKSIDPAVMVAVVHGTDDGLIRETADKAAKAFAARSEPAGDILRIEDVDLDETPDKLIVELQTIPMFGGAKVIRTSTSRRINANYLKPAFETAAPPSALVIEAGNLKPTDALRKLADKLAWCVSLPCYADTTRDLGSLIDETLAQARMTISPDAREALQARLGADRGLSRAEVEKLALYAHGRSEITLDDVLAVVGDASSTSLDKIILAAQSGRATDALNAVNHAIASGQQAQSILLALQRHFLMLHRLRASMDGGKRFDEVARTMRPPLHFSVRDAAQTALTTWTLPLLTLATGRIQSAIADSRGGLDLDTALAERVVLELSRLGAPRRAR
jgi:DNA polymerase-3 subunit delta